MADQTYTADSLTSVVFPGATATLDNGVLTLTSLQGPPGEANDGNDGNDGIDATMQNVKIGNDTYTASNINTVEFIGAAGVLNGTTLEVSGLKGDKGDVGDASTVQGPQGDSAMAIVLAPDASGTVMTYENPSKLAFTNAVGSIDALQTLTITPTGPTISVGPTSSYLSDQR